MFTRKKTAAGFQARSSDRDAQTDATRAKVVQGAIDKVLAELESEKSGLAARLADVIARASVTVGNEADEYRTRDSARDAQQSAFSADIRYAEGRLVELAAQIETYQALKARLAG